eukprot:TRINITY_DN27493_c0_g1_i1.p1 TRINITY_DN27493_c0_g1~~TRINITY_DN27493_c0_g1_i1.p1  ORF type:complete len:605 (+),score=104.26 TRINITY_DN27493_c0_g1_i1:196-2010(+)
MRQQRLSKGRPASAGSRISPGSAGGSRQEHNVVVGRAVSSTVTVGEPAAAVLATDCAVSLASAIGQIGVSASAAPVAGGAVSAALRLRRSNSASPSERIFRCRIGGETGAAAANPDLASAGVGAAGVGTSASTPGTAKQLQSSPRHERGGYARPSSASRANRRPPVLRSAGVAGRTGSEGPSAPAVPAPVDPFFLPSSVKELLGAKGAPLFTAQGALASSAARARTPLASAASGGVNRQRAASEEASGCYPSDTCGNSTARGGYPSAHGADAIEMSLYRARLDLRLDAERVKTREASSELRKACDIALQQQQESAVGQLEAVRQRYEETSAMWQASEQLAVGRERARGEEACSAIRTEVVAARQASAAYEVELQAARAELTTEMARAQMRQADAENLVRAERLRCKEDVEMAQAEFQEQREAQVAKVVALFEAEHFDLSLKAASEIERRERTKVQLEEALIASDELRREAARSHQLKPLAAYVSTGAQTNDAWMPRLDNAQRERLSMRCSDVESRLSCAVAADEGRLKVLESRTRRALALKDDLIEGLRSELWQSQREIVEARGIMTDTWETTPALAAENSIYLPGISAVEGILALPPEQHHVD